MIVNIQPSLNRSIIITSYLINKSFQFVILHHKMTPALRFDIDSENGLFKTHTAYYRMFRNLDKCLFSRTFFRMETLKDETNDFRSRFVSIKSYFKDHLNEFFREKYDFSSYSSDHNQTNNMYVTGWKIYGLEDDFVYYYVQRRCFNNLTKTNIIRTAGIQLYTKKGLELFNKYEEYATGSFTNMGDQNDLFVEPISTDNGYSESDICFFDNSQEQSTSNVSIGNG